MASNDAYKPTPERPLLVGLLVDVSGSMLRSMNNRAGDTRSRLESFRDSLEDLVDRAKDLSMVGSDDRIAPLIRIFAYGFGFGGPLTILFGGRGDKVRDLLTLPGSKNSTVPIDRLAANWLEYKENLASLARSMAGDTPMLEGFRMVRDRIRQERAARSYTGAPVLFVLSDGDPTDAQPPAIQQIAADIKEDGVTIISCYVTEHDIAKPRHLYGRPGNWPEGAKLMFECASRVQAPSPFERYLVEYEWELEPECRFFTQINQSEILSEFLNLVLSPLREQDPRPSVFISYSHQDRRWLDRIRIHLKQLERAGLVDVWDDTRIAAGDDWRAEIRSSIEAARVAILLISADFLASDFISADELPPVLEAARNRGVVVLPVIVGASQFSDTPSLARFQAVNSPSAPLNDVRKSDAEHVLVALGKRVRDALSLS